MEEVDFRALEKDLRWRGTKTPIFLSDFIREYFQETNRESNIENINTFLDSFSNNIKGSIINNLNQDDAEESLKKLDKRIAAAREIICNIEKIPENVLQIVTDLYSPEEIPLDLNSCIYSNGTFRAKATKNFRHHIKSNPNYRTAINAQFAINQAAYLIGGIEYNLRNRLQEYVKKCEDLMMYIIDCHYRFPQKALKIDDFYIEGSILNTKTLSKPEGKKVFTTMVFKLVDPEGEVYNYCQMSLSDFQGFEFKNISKLLNK